MDAERRGCSPVFQLIGEVVKILVVECCSVAVGEADYVKVIDEILLEWWSLKPLKCFAVFIR